mgnify:CR=1 FL=1
MSEFEQSSPSQGASNPANPSGWERETLERLVFAQLQEQRVARRWRNAIRLLWLGVVLAVLWLSFSRNTGSAHVNQAHTAVVQIQGEIASEADASADWIVGALRDAFEDEGAQAVVLLINSPGGSPVQSGLIYDEIRRMRTQYPDTPLITYNSVIFKDCINPSVADTLILKVDFKDGDGNLGIDGQDNSPPFNNRWYFRINPASQCESGLAEPCSKIKRSSFDPARLNDYVTYKLRRTNPKYYTLPAFTSPYNCTNYEIIYDNELLKPVDTIYMQLNKGFFNFYMDIYVKQNNGSFQKFEIGRAHV